MSIGDYPDSSAEEMSSSLPPLKWSKEIFDGLVQNFKFPKSWGVMYPEEGQTAAQAPAGYITLFWDYFTEGNFRLPVTRFVLDILHYYKFYISQLNPMGMVRIRHCEFLCRSMHIEPTVDHFRVFYQLHCSQGFYSFAQCPSAKKILLSPPKSFHEWKPKFFFIKAGVIPMKMTLRGAEDTEVETLKTSEAGIWYQDMKDHHDKPVYVEDDKIISLYVVAYKREHGKMTTVQKSANEEPWYHQIVRNFALPRDADLSAQPSTNVGELTNLDIGPESKKKKCVPIATAAPKKFDTLKADVLKEEKKKVKRKQPEGGAVAQTVKNIGRKKISKKGNLDALAAKLSPDGSVPSAWAEPSSVFNDDLPPSPPRVSIREQLEGTKTVEVEMEKAVEVEKPVEVELEAEKIMEAETADVGATKPKSPPVMAYDPERGKSILEEGVPVITIPSSATTSAPPRDDVEENPVKVD
ncbi:hypothetical protein Hdeb2414_s0007g00245281 [Helianthus debilis subsp. tardiflorus]